jgi:hypothetical protein
MGTSKYSLSFPPHHWFMEIVVGGGGSEGDILHIEPLNIKNDTQFTECEHYSLPSWVRGKEERRGRGGTEDKKETQALAYF